MPRPVLGIDTVKQAEMFAAVRAAYNIPRDQALKLRDFPTLAHVIRFAVERQAGAQVPSPQTEVLVRDAKTSPGDRHGKTGGDVCGRACRLQHSSRSGAEAARLSDAGACDPLCGGAAGWSPSSLASD